MRDFNSALYQLVGKRIKERREQLHLSQIELSTKINLGRSSVSNIEKGKQQPPLSVIYQICHALDIDVQAILPTNTEVQSELELEKSSVLQELHSNPVNDIVLNQIKKFVEKTSK